MKVYVMRHGQTDWNGQHRVQGQTNVPLNDTGRLEAQKAALRLADVALGHVYCSELLRARETAEIVSGGQRHGGVACVPVACLNEQHFGRFEGVDSRDAELQRMRGKLCRRYEGGGESYFDVAARVYPFLDWLKTQSDDKVLLVTHNGILRVIANYFLDFENDEFVSFGMDNCEVRCFEL